MGLKKLEGKKEEEEGVELEGPWSCFKVEGPMVLSKFSFLLNIGVRGRGHLWERFPRLGKSEGGGKMTEVSVSLS